MVSLVSLLSAVVRTFCGIGLGVVVGVTDVVVRVRRREPEVGLVPDVVLICVDDVLPDRLLLGEDAVGETGVSLLVPPSAFFWTAVVERRFVDGDDAWVLTFPLDVGVVLLESVTNLVGSWIGTLEVFDVEHWIASMRVVMSSERIAMVMRRISPSSQACCQ